jgi:hypothetical protein
MMRSVMVRIPIAEFSATMNAIAECLDTNQYKPTRYIGQGGSFGRDPEASPSRQRNATMRLPHELRPFYAAVNRVKLPAWDTPSWRVRDLESTLGASPADIAAARRAVAVAAVELTRLVDALRLFKTERATVAYFGQA